GNYYVPRRVKARECPYELDYFTPEYYFENYIDPEGRFNPYRDNNEIYPQAIYDIASNIRDNYGNIKWYLAEIGIAMDVQSEGPVQTLFEQSGKRVLLRMTTQNPRTVFVT
ncbi:hypothetical protein ACUOFC_48850, partial [Escherichia sp. TWPC-MK]